MSGARAFEGQTGGSTGDSPARRQMEEQFNTSTMQSPGGYGPNHGSRGGSRDAVAFGETRANYRINRVQRGGGGGAQPREESGVQGMGPLPQPGGPMHRQTMHPYVPRSLPPGTGYPDFSPMGETDE